MKSFSLPATFILTLGITFSAHAEIFKWVDTQGNTHYSQTPPQDKVTKAEDIEDDIEMAAGTGRSGPKEGTDKTAGKADEIETARQTGEKNQVKHQAFCDQQHSALKQLLANPVILWKSKDADKILTAKERKGKISEFEKNIKDLCNPDVLAAKEKVSAK